MVLGWKPNLAGVYGPPAGVARKLGKVSSASSYRTSKLRGPPQKGPSITSKREVNITKLNILQVLHALQQIILLMSLRSKEELRISLLHSHLLHSYGTIQSGGASVMVWDVCGWRDLGPLIRLETTMTGDRYLSILSDHLHSFMSIVHSDGLRQFQQDNATPHMSTVAA
ncbi:hypothetical protein AVEN_84715-1, partial [Araneus ventricosus]